MRRRRWMLRREWRCWSKASPSWRTSWRAFPSCRSTRWSICFSARALCPPTPSHFRSYRSFVWWWICCSRCYIRTIYDLCTTKSADDIGGKLYAEYKKSLMDYLDSRVSSNRLHLALHNLKKKKRFGFPVLICSALMVELSWASTPLFVLFRQLDFE